MVRPQIIDKVLYLHVRGIDKILSFKNQLSFPIEHIKSIRTDEDIVHELFHGLHLPGLNIPHVITAGTYYQDGKRIFWDIHHPKVAVVICLDYEDYDEIIIEMEHPQEFVDKIENIIRFAH